MNTQEQLDFTPVHDWSTAGRTHFFARHEDTIRLALDLAFTDLIDQLPLSLGRFGFRGADPIAEVIDWCIERFCHGDLDHEQISPADRSIRLFTIPHFWLSQRVGKSAYESMMRQVHGINRAGSDASLGEEHRGNVSLGRAQNSADVGDLIASIRQRLAQTLAALRAATCPDMVALWLFGSRKLRAEWFGWRTEETSSLRSGLSSKKRSFLVADALFRYLLLYLEWPRSAQVGVAERSGSIVVQALLTPCPNIPPYRVSMTVARKRQASLSATPRIALLVDELATLVGLACELSETLSSSETATFEALLAAKSVKASLLHHYGLKDPQLTDRVTRLKELHP